MRTSPALVLSFRSKGIVVLIAVLIVAELQRAVS
jgi:hypothetical protein